MRNLFTILLPFLFACGTASHKTDESEAAILSTNKVIKGRRISLIVLGNVQDAGSPQIGCTKNCCNTLWKGNHEKRYITSLGLIDNYENKNWLFEASPDFKHQVEWLSKLSSYSDIQMPNGIFLTHAHIGHYVGLMQLGREAIGANEVPVFAMPRMKKYLENNGPWSQLVNLKNIQLQPLKADSTIILSNKLSVLPFLVPHRGEYTETVGYKIIGPNKSALFIPDIDKWNKWEKAIDEEIQQVDFAFLDATFFKNGEVGNRDMSEIPHPFVEESMKRFANLSAENKSKIYFVHFNHTNPLLQKNSNAQKEVLSNGFNIAEQGMVVEL